VRSRPASAPGPAYLEGRCVACGEERRPVRRSVRVHRGGRHGVTEGAVRASSHPCPRPQQYVGRKAAGCVMGVRWLESGISPPSRFKANDWVRASVAVGSYAPPSRGRYEQGSRNTLELKVASVKQRGNAATFRLARHLQTSRSWAVLGKKGGARGYVLRRACRRNRWQQS